MTLQAAELVEPMSAPLYKDEDWLREEYLEKGRTLEDIASQFDVRKTAIAYWTEKLDIPTRSGGYQPADPEPYRDEAWLREKYHGDEQSTTQIADRCDCSKETIRRWLDRHGIEARSASEAAEVRAREHPHTTDAGAEALLEAPNWWHESTEEEREAFREQLREERTGSGNPMHDVTGEDHPQWKDETSPRHFYHSPRWERVREKALERDDYECQDCGATEETWRLHVHHIERISEGGARYELDNLVTVCPPCHGKRHGGND